VSLPCSWPVREELGEGASFRSVREPARRSCLGELFLRDVRSAKRGGNPLGAEVCGHSENKIYLIISLHYTQSYHQSGISIIYYTASNV
jgi:hypothetical protein